MENLDPPVGESVSPDEGPDFVTALARGLIVMRAFGTGSSRLTLSDIAKQVGLARATVRRSLITLQAMGYVQSDGRHFSLSPKVLSLGNSYLTSSPLPRVVQPLLERFAESTRESSWVAILDEDEALLIAGAKSNRLLAAGLAVGSRLPAYCTAHGRVLLAGLPDDQFEAYLTRLTPRNYTSRTITEASAIRQVVLEVRSSGYSIADSELETGLCSIAVPITDTQGRTLASVNATAPSGRVSRSEMLERFLPLLRQIADDIRPELD